MRVFVTGTRGIPEIPGGVEKHCEELFPRIVALGHEVILSRRSSYVQDTLRQWKGVQLIDCFAPRVKSLEAIVHTMISLIKARMLSPDVVHIHAVGPSLLVPIGRLLGLKVIVTNHGPDYDRQKWGRVAKGVLKLGELLGGIFANEVIVISEVIREIVRRRCHRDANLIPNGVTLPVPSTGTDYLEDIGVRPGEYILAVARFVPEKGLHDLIEAFEQMSGEYQLVIAGDADHETEYSSGLKSRSKADDRIILTGYITGEKLNQVYSHARLFVLPSYHEGLPIALLEALSYGLSVLVSDIPANKEVGLSPERYFRCGDMKDLVHRMQVLVKESPTYNESSSIKSQVAEKYNWDRIAEQTIEVYNKALGM
jgi:glycosyltransferase involved in cell wall biosynthesis